MNNIRAIIAGEKTNTYKNESNDKNLFANT